MDIQGEQTDGFTSHFIVLLYNMEENKKKQHTDLYCFKLKAMLFNCKTSHCDIDRTPEWISFDFRLLLHPCFCFAKAVSMIYSIHRQLVLKW